jgi:hypothetical protein
VRTGFVPVCRFSYPDSIRTRAPSTGATCSNTVMTTTRLQLRLGLTARSCRSKMLLTCYLVAECDLQRLVAETRSKIATTSVRFCSLACCNAVLPSYSITEELGKGCFKNRRFPVRKAPTMNRTYPVDRVHVDAAISDELFDNANMSNTSCAMQRPSILQTAS